MLIGDNEQVESIAETLVERFGWPVEVRRLRYKDRDCRATSVPIDLPSRQALIFDG